MINSDEAMKIISTAAILPGNEKKRFLRNKDIKEFLLAAYDPFTKYHITNCEVGLGSNQFDIVTWKILGQLSTRELSGDNAKSIVNIHTRKMTKASSELFRCILTKDLRFGAGAKVINKIFPSLIPIHNVMLAKLYNKSRLQLPCFGSPKIDGVRGDVKNGKVYSRRGHEYKGLNHIIKELNPIISGLTGELIVPGFSFQIGSGMIRSDNNTPHAVFHMIDITTEDVPFKERLTTMNNLHLIGNHIVKVPHIMLYTKEEVANYYVMCRNAGYEGAVIKSIEYKYRGTRSYDWMKIKPVDNIDLKVIELYEGKGKYKGQMGGAIVIFNGQENKVGGGWNDKQRKDFWKNPLLIINHVIEIFFMEKTDEGNMRHARFIQFREDKDNE